MFITQRFKNAVKLDFAGTVIGVTLDTRRIYWMSDWGKCQEWINRGLIREKWYPHSMHHTDQLWQLPIKGVDF